MANMIPLGNLGIPPIGNANAINKILQELQTCKLTQKQFESDNLLDSEYLGVPEVGFQVMPAQGPISNANFLALWREYISVQLDQLRNAVFIDFWRAVPDNVHTQMLFLMKLIDTNPRFIIPVQIALNFFPRLVDWDYENILVTGMMDKKPWTMRYEYNSGTNHFEITTEWDTFLTYYSLAIGDSVIFYVHRNRDLSVRPMKCIFYV